MSSDCSAVGSRPDRRFAVRLTSEAAASFATLIICAYLIGSSASSTQLNAGVAAVARAVTVALPV
jgi:uncharacterized MAPEG superfamily protein